MARLYQYKEGKLSTFSEEQLEEFYWDHPEAMLDSEI